MHKLMSRKLTAAKLLHNLGLAGTAERVEFCYNLKLKMHKV